jgi:hypothetical protein
LQDRRYRAHALSEPQFLNHNSYEAIALHVCHEQPAQELMIHYALPCESAIADKVMRKDMGFTIVTPGFEYPTGDRSVF